MNGNDTEARHPRINRNHACVLYITYVITRSQQTEQFLRQLTMPRALLTSRILWCYSLLVVAAERIDRELLAQHSTFLVILPRTEVL